MSTVSERVVADLDVPGGVLGQSHALPVAVLVAVALHLVVVLGLGFERPPADSPQARTRPLEVIVLRQPAPSDERPKEADAFAQVDRVGAGSERPQELADASPIEPLPPEPLVHDEPEPAPAPAQVPEERPPQPDDATTLTATVEPLPLPLPEPELPLPAEAPPPPPPAPPVSAADILASRNLEIAQLTARIGEQTSAYANRARRKAISASTREYKYASYLEAWRRKVEAIGNLNYPQEAKRRKLYGNLILHVAVRSDGTLERVRVLRSSGVDLLDEAAIRIVELAAPFAPFPPEIRAEADVLDITRTWQFLSTNRLGWGN